MTVEIGHFALILALLVSFVQMSVPLVGAHRADSRLMAVGEPAAQAVCVLLVLSFLMLTHAFVVSDFSVELVAANSHPAKPLLYKLSGVWGNHEGSLLLWVLILAAFGAAVASFGANLPSALRARVLAVQAMIAAAFLLFMLMTSNPFARLDPAPIIGADLNPILQDPALAIHPPFLYLGYVGFSVAFAFAVAALIGGRVDAAWARWVRPWTLAAWVCLTIGIALGSYWAYYELGWGGFWFWDPVENASLMPWLAGTALLHSAIVVEKREALKVWTILLAILTFSLSLIGTFLVRSGVLTSVHAFAVDPGRGVFILAILAIAIGGSLTLFAWRAPALRAGSVFAPMSRETSLVLNNLILTVSCAAVFIGTLYPLFIDALTGDKLSVGAPFFNKTLGPLMLPLLIAMPFGPLLAWKRADLLGATQRLFAAAGMALTVGVLVAAMSGEGHKIGAAIGVGLAVWVIVGALTEIATRIRLFAAPWRVSLDRALGLPRAAWGAMFAHAGVGLLVLGLTGVIAWREEVVTVMAPGDTTRLGAYEVAFKRITPLERANYRADAGSFDIMRNGRTVATVTSEKRVYWTVRMPTTEVGLHKTIGADVYIVLGDPQADLPGLKDPPRAGAYVVRMYINPLVSFIYIGSLVMALGGVVSLTDRRLRLGAPERTRRAAPKEALGAPAAE